MYVYAFQPKRKFLSACVFVKLSVVDHGQVLLAYRENGMKSTIPRLKEDKVGKDVWLRFQTCNIRIYSLYCSVIIPHSQLHVYFVLGFIIIILYKCTCACVLHTVVYIVPIKDIPIPKHCK